MPRYTRDEILIQGLELAASPTVSQHDIAGGVIQENAWCIKWLQNALDMFHRKYPFSSDVQSIAMVLPGSSIDLMLDVQGSNRSMYLPDDWILDVRNGLIVTVSNQSFRLKRQSFQYWLNSSLAMQNTNASTLGNGGIYTIINNRIKIAPTVSSSTSITMWYYALPALTEANEYPPFPDEWSLIEFVHLKAKEWTRAIDVGTAQIYLQRELARFKSEGLLNDTEYESIPIENNQVLLDGSQYNRNNWMGTIGT